MKQKRLINKITSFCLLILLAFAFFTPCLMVKTSVSASTSQTVDMYLIAGQSNAAGYSDKGSLDQTFTNVGYAGEVDKQLNNAGAGVSNVASYSEYLWKTTAGLGRTSNHIGPEYGIAKQLNAKYTGSTKAFIFKTASGGTALRDSSTSGNAKFGNWYPRSKWVSGYTPDPTSNDPTGVMYYNFIENFKIVYQNLVANGYTPVVKGMAWMQGEDDLGYDSEYKVLLKAFITDIRTDLRRITGDTDLATMPFVIGKIATSFGQYNHRYVPSFNAIQQEVADEMDGVETIETSDLIIVNQDGTINGTDLYHFNTADAVTLGQRFGDKLLQMNGKYVFFDAYNVVCSYQEKVDGSMEISVQAQSGYVITKVTVNGVDITAQLQEGKYTLLSPPKETYVVVKTQESSLCTIAYADVENGDFLYWYEHVEKRAGETLQVKVRADEGYEVEGVYCNGGAMLYNADLGVYEIVIERDSIITASLREKDDSFSAGMEDSPSMGSSCTSSLNTFSGGIVLILCASAMALLLRKKG
jgi:hypothetical protein